MKKPKVLAVDDTPANLIALQAVLHSDFELILANSGPEAIAVLNKGCDVDVVLMDLQMPGMDGFEAARRIKAMTECADVPIVFITAVFKEDPYIKLGYEAGGVDYFTKPFDPDLLRLKMSIYASFRQKAAILREREQHLRETEQLLSAGRKLSAVLESLPVGVMITDTQGRVCQINDEVSRICRAAELVGENAYGKVLTWWDSDGQTFKNQKGALARALQAGESTHNELVAIRCMDGSSKTISSSTSPLFGLDGAIVGAVIVIQDVTEPRKIGEELEGRITNLVSLGVELEQSIDRPAARS